VDETYVDYAGAGESLETLAANRANVVVCKSLSKAYALSGARAAYMCSAQTTLDALRGYAPPWSVGLLAQVAAIAALQDEAYYRARWEETNWLREQLAQQLTQLTGWEVLPSIANFLLCHLPMTGPTAAQVVAMCRQRGLYLRDVGSMGRHFGKHVLRIAVKDAATNLQMLKLLESSLDELGATGRPVTREPVAA
jgi:histidinol-phosphate/aromatic aminotransferase/cobyric acid decarboxylase-like protein